MAHMNLSLSETRHLSSGKKRSLNVDMWNDKKQQALRNAGQQYVSKRGKGNVVPAKQLPVSRRSCLPEICSKQGCSTISLDMVHTMHSRFYNLNYNQQTLLLTKCVNIREPKYRRPGKSDSTSKKLAAFDYNITGKPVCLKTLLNTFEVGRKRIRVIQEKLKKGEIAPMDTRGFHLNRPHAVDSEKRKLVKLHIESFPVMENHYSRNSSQKNVLSVDLSVKKMHRLFVEKYPESEVSYSLYRKIFNREFKLRFGSPRSDTCKQCDKFYAELILASNTGERKRLEIESTIHHIQADSAYKTLAEDGRNKNFIALCVDLQQVLSTPAFTHADMYYQRQYSSYNFAIHNMTADVASMYLWHEVLAKRGSKEIGSCLLDYIKTTYRTLGPGEERKVIIWSDRCCGQNNNKTVLTLYWYLIQCGYFTEVHQKFMVTGHSFLPCDRDFAVIERRRKIQKAIVPGDWKHIIASSKISKPFLITEMTQDKFRDIDVVTTTCLKKNATFQITKYVWYKLCKDDPTTLYARESHNTLRPWKTFRMFDPTVGIPVIQDLPFLYTSLLPISKEKKKDLLQMTTFMTDPTHKLFYTSLPSL